MSIQYPIKKCCSLIVITMLSLTTAVAQDSITNTTRPVFVQAALLYDFPQSYGASAGATIPFASVARKKLPDTHTITKQKDYFISGTIGFYRYPYNYTGTYFFPSLGVHVSKASVQTYHEFAAGLGLLRTFYDGKVYKIDVAGNVRELQLYGRFYAVANFSYALGWQFRKPKLAKWDIQLKPSLWLQFPYNSFIKPHIAAEAGIRYHFGDIKLRTKRM